MTMQSKLRAAVVTSASGGADRRRLARHYIEMVLAMLAGVAVFGMLRDFFGWTVGFDVHPGTWFLPC
ncbi:hypothetical protein [Rhodococcus chondri]|uniref:Uncharacterized protein n=1 Tax=Rhodococcus chondri TaxID=3065941 RepID=A0ABU7JPK9_9NOCA|nr:hypothetical protein [Rhodococcus sp. CC-R104]MEE2031966.1 hypothetical protein [Rhodococcus sp. CC-R104]